MHLRKILTHVVSHRPPVSLSARPRPNSWKAPANISCKRSVDMEGVWAPDWRSSGSRRDTSLGCLTRLRRTFPLGFAGSQLRSLKRWRRQPPLSPAVLRRHPYAALLDVAVQGAPAQVSAPKRQTLPSAFTGRLLPWLRERPPWLFFLSKYWYCIFLSSHLQRMRRTWMPQMLQRSRWGEWAGSDGGATDID